MTTRELVDDLVGKKVTDEFLDYVFSFYGKGGIYDMGATKDQILSALHDYTQDPDFISWCEGDSVDRERVRDILINKFNLVFPD